MKYLVLISFLFTSYAYAVGPLFVGSRGAESLTQAPDYYFKRSTTGTNINISAVTVHTYTMKVAGRYRIEVAADISNGQNIAGSDRAVRVSIGVNGPAVAGSTSTLISIEAANTDYTSVSSFTYQDLKAGDVITAYFTSTLNTVARHSESTFGIYGVPLVR